MGPASTGSTSSHQPETTFKNYSAQQARAYESARSNYPKILIDHIISHHITTGGSLDTLLDVGCGPGKAIRDMAPYFTCAIGIDPSPQMIETAKVVGGRARSNDIEYRVSEAETLDGITDGSIDLLTSGAAAHWFDMERFWHAASRVVKSRGTVALFVLSYRFIHPSTPHAAELQNIMNGISDGELRDHRRKGNDLVRDNYASLHMPWDVPTPAGGFVQGDEYRKVWNLEGEPESDGTYFGGVQQASLSVLEKRYGTASSVTRWRDANPELVGTERDILSKVTRKIQDLFGEDDPVISFVGPTILITVKRA